MEIMDIEDLIEEVNSVKTRDIIALDCRASKEESSLGQIVCAVLLTSV